MNVKITGSGYYIPDRIETAEQVAQKINKNADWIISHTGVQNRHISDIDVDEMGALAARDALSGSSEPDLIINASGVPKQTIPDTSVFIQKALGFSGTPSFSIHSTCLSFLTAFNMASSLIHSKQYQKILIVSSDRGSIGRNFNEPESAALLGDAAAAIVVEPSTTSKILSHKMETWSEGALFTQVRGGGTYRHPDNPKTIDKDHYFTMSGPNVYKMARKKVYYMIQTILKENNLTTKEIDFVIPHQASNTAIQAYVKFGGFPEHKVMNIIADYGNCVSASLPLALSIAIQENKIKRGDLVLIIGTGAGLSVSASLIKF
tara:strand:+ start:8399 stop:9355 length:957 start_codon:yes stop_codon:yes gene_type:complete